MTVEAGLVHHEKLGRPGDPNEKLLRGLTWFTEGELRTMIRRGEIYCGYTLSALQLLAANGGPRTVIGFIEQDIAAATRV